MSRTATLSTRLDTHLRELRLPAFREAYEEEARRAESESFSYEQYLMELVQRECEDRRQHRVERNLRASRLPTEKTLSGFDLKRLPTKVRQQVQSLKDGVFLKRCENVLAFGNPGSGKTHLLCGLGRELIENGYRVYFAPCGLLVQDLLIAKRELKLTRVLKRLSKFDALILDDIGYVQQN
ncbi:MAG: ATP-binding protein, partial [Candidatus Omnitrophica bacterium]|nr:ATP-binding protein [Candidatus Omnitrophota bacterium]